MTVTFRRHSLLSFDLLFPQAVATQADFVILGSPRRYEHVSKYNRLIEIERDLETSHKFLQKQPLVPVFVDTKEEKQNGDSATNGDS